MRFKDKAFFHFRSLLDLFMAALVSLFFSFLAAIIYAIIVALFVAVVALAIAGGEAAPIAARWAVIIAGSLAWLVNFIKIFSQAFNAYSDNLARFRAKVRHDELEEDLNKSS